VCSSVLQTRICAVCLFFIAVWPLSAEEAPPTPAGDESRVLVQQLGIDNARLKADLEQRETTIRLLTENLAVARTESELFQKRWSEAQLRAQALGVNFADESAKQAQGQFVESVRALYLVEAERQRLIEQLQRLIVAVQQQGDVTGELAHATALLAVTDRPRAGEPGTVVRAHGSAEGTLGAATVLDVSQTLRLVVLNIGLLHGARVGMPLVVLRGDHVVAELKVVEVRQRICGALIERTDGTVKLRAGDIARVTKSS
jgi:hypothetical protein